jgi:nicotinate dehydrogenase subunit A
MTEITLRVNGRNHKVAVDPNMPLLYALRDDLGLRGPKFGCGLGQCGACCVLIDREAQRSCVTLAVDAREKEITTLEGLGDPDRPSRVQAAFIAEQAAQCGYCTNGMIMTATALLARRPHPEETDVRDALAQNLCRCGSHARVITAVLRAAREG